jgi:hypothetical protein
MTLLAGGVYLLINVVGLVVAVSRWNKHPIASVLVITATGLAILGRVAQVAMMRTLSTETYWVMESASGLVSNVGVACLLGAAFVERSGTSGPVQPFR